LAISFRGRSWCDGRDAFRSFRDRGGTLIIPALVFIPGFTQHKAQGTSLAALLLQVGILGVIRYHKAGDVDWIAGLILAGGLLVGAYFGAGWAGKLNEVWLKRAFGIFFILLGVRYILTKSPTP